MQLPTNRHFKISYRYIYTIPENVSYQCSEFKTTLHGIVSEFKFLPLESEAETEASVIVQNRMRIMIPKKWSLEMLWKRTIQSWNRVVYRSEILTSWPTALQWRRCKGRLCCSRKLSLS